MVGKEIEHQRGLIIPRNPSWVSIEKYTQSLAAIINKSDFKPEYIVGISRGGWVPAILLSHLMAWTPFASIDVKKEGEERRVAENPLINWPALKGKRVLLVEDMLETGKSAQVAREFLEQYGADVRLACYFARNYSEVKPDFVLREGMKREVSFRWERFRETYAPLVRNQ